MKKINLIFIMSLMSVNAFAQSLECGIRTKQGARDEAANAKAIKKLTRGQINWKAIEDGLQSAGLKIKDLFDGPEGCEQDDIDQIVKYNQKFEETHNFDNFKWLVNKLYKYKEVSSQKNCRKHIEFEINCESMSDVKKDILNSPLKYMFGTEYTHAVPSLSNYMTFYRNLNSPEIGCNLKLTCQELMDAALAHPDINKTNVKKNVIKFLTDKNFKADTYKRLGIDASSSCVVPSTPKVVEEKPVVPETVTEIEPPKEEVKKIDLKYFDFGYEASVARARESSEAHKINEVYANPERYLSLDLPADLRIKAAKKIKADIDLLRKKYTSISEIKLDIYSGVCIAHGSTTVNKNYQSSGASNMGGSKVYIVNEDGSVEQTTEEDAKKRGATKMSDAEAQKYIEKVK